MKKFLAIAMIATTFAACNEGEKKAEETPVNADSANATTTTPAPAPADTTAKKDTAAMTTPAAADTTKK